MQRATLEVSAMTTRSLRSRALQQLQQLRDLVGLTVRDRDNVLEELEQITIELAARAEQGKLF